MTLSHVPNLSFPPLVCQYLQLLTYAWSILSTTDVSIPSIAMPGKFYASPTWAGYLETQRSKLLVLSEVDDGFSDRVVRFLGSNPGSMQLQGINFVREPTSEAY